MQFQNKQANLCDKTRNVGSYGSEAKQRQRALCYNTIANSLLFNNNNKRSMQSACSVQQSASNCARSEGARHKASLASPSLVIEAKILVQRALC